MRPAFFNEVCLASNGITQEKFAQKLSELTQGKIKIATMSIQVREVILGKRSMCARFALLISELIGTEAKMWLSLQSNLDLWKARRKLGF